MKNLVLIAAGALTGIAIDYSAFSFIAWNWNPGTWSEVMRAVEVLLGVAFAMGGGGLTAIVLAEGRP